MLLELVAAEDDELLGPHLIQHDLRELPAEGACSPGDQDGELGPVQRARSSCRTVRYQSTVRRIPTSSGVVARKPKSLSARLPSTERRGCPLGRFVSQITSPEKPVASTTIFTRASMLISRCAPRFTGSAPS